MIVIQLDSPFYFSVRLTGIEPARRKTLDPKSSASANSATSASGMQRYAIFSQTVQNRRKSC